MTGVSTSQAEIYRPSAVPGTAVLGAVAGALIGGHNNHHWVEGAVIGAAAGALVGVAVDSSRQGYYGREIHPGYAPVVTHAPRVVYVEPYPRPVIVSRPIVYIAHGGHGHHHYSHRSHHRHHKHHHRHHGYDRHGHSR